ncbi:MAG: FtsX-like permease family protein, partial [Bacteroidetes bacterium]|nr:FtsX-like permease family protein [Bacteroidota bacterium]
AGDAVGVAVVFGLLALVAKGLMWAAQRFAPTSWSYPWRQGLANLHRPNNQTSILMLALGLGTFLILTLVLVQRMLLTQIEVSSGEGQPNLVLFDIQPQQVEQVSTLVRGEGLPVLDEVPVVSMRLQAVEGRTVEELREDPEARTTWAHRREYRSTYRDHLIDSEEITAGSFTARHTDGSEPIPISLEEGIAEELNVGLGDQLMFDVQGRSMTTEVTSLRAVDWQRVQTNFFVVFPEGVLEAAPQFSVVLTRTETEEASAAVQRAVVEQFPNVSAIDLSLILAVAEDLFERVALVIRFMALFSILTGLIVLIGAVAVSRYQRVEESVLLKTLGASRAQVFKILLIEYLFLGVLASLTGIVLSLAGAGILALFVFDAPFVWAPDALALTLAVVTGLTVGVGLLNSRGLYNRPPLEVLRAATT